MICRFAEDLAYQVGYIWLSMLLLFLPWHLTHACRPYATSMTSVPPSVCLSVTIVDYDRIVQEEVEIRTWQDRSVSWQAACITWKLTPIVVSCDPEFDGGSRVWYENWGGGLHFGPWQHQTTRLSRNGECLITFLKLEFCVFRLLDCKCSLNKLSQSYECVRTYVLIYSIVDTVWVDTKHRFWLTRF